VIHIAHIGEKGVLTFAVVVVGLCLLYHVGHRGIGLGREEDTRTRITITQTTLYTHKHTHGERDIET
jgi:hypothetical protein